MLLGKYYISIMLIMILMEQRNKCQKHFHLSSYKSFLRDIVIRLLLLCKYLILSRRNKSQRLDSCELREDILRNIYLEGIAMTY